ncbi:MAG: zinc dependent phospholipase C family protein [Negativicutes bacterium]
MIDVLNPTPAEACLHLVLTAISPFQTVLDQPGLTHEFCNYQAFSILQNDGFVKYSNFLSSYALELNMGVYWADKDWKNAHHYFEPSSRKGLWHFTNALDNFKLYYQLALKSAKRHNVKKAVFLLGAAAHLMQDLCVPHHARVKLFNGHKPYEIWAQERRGKYAVTTQGVYQEGRSPSSLMINNAVAAADFFDWVRHEGDDSFYHKATEILLPLAQRSTAGLFRSFASEVLHFHHLKQRTIVA